MDLFPLQATIPAKSDLILITRFSAPLSYSRTQNQAYCSCLSVSVVLPRQAGPEIPQVDIKLLTNHQPTPKPFALTSATWYRHSESVTQVSQYLGLCVSVNQGGFGFVEPLSQGFGKRELIIEKVTLYVSCMLHTNP
jgi:hypothetical protein